MHLKKTLNHLCWEEDVRSVFHLDFANKIEGHRWVFVDVSCIMQMPSAIYRMCSFDPKNVPNHTLISSKLLC